QYLTAPAWFRQAHGQSPLSRVAYFSMELALSEALPIYSGGLGNVAGDQLKAASDLGVPVTGVGVLYQEGYFRQVITADGSQEALYPYNDPDQLPITPVRSQSGDLLRLPVELPGYKVWLRAWQVQVGREPARDRKSTRLNSSHGSISYAVFCLKKKKATIYTS